MIGLVSNPCDVLRMRPPRLIFLCWLLFLMVGLSPFQTQASPDPLRVLFMIGEQEYETARTLPEFARQELTPRGVTCHFAIVDPGDPNHFPGLDMLENTDVWVLSVRRRTPSVNELTQIRQFLERGGALVALRTASHAFDQEPPDLNHGRWEHFDQEVLGGDYQGHYGNKPPDDPPSLIRLNPDNREHPVLAGVPPRGFVSVAHLYRNRNMAPDVQILLDGRIDGQSAVEPVSWVRHLPEGNRVFYTSLGHPNDFRETPFRRHLLNAVFWAGGKPIPKALLHPEAEQKEAVQSDYLEGWSPIDLPASWESQSVKSWQQHDGYAWYRAYVHIPASWAGSRLLLTADSIDDVDEAFFNGIKVGANGSMPPLYGDPSSDIRRPFVIHPEWIRFGSDNLIAWRVYDKGGQGGIIQGPVHLSRRDDAIDLQGKWLFRTGDMPSWSNWYETPKAGELSPEAEAFRIRTGSGFAGHLGIVDADLGGRQRRLQEVHDRYRGNTNVHALTEGKGLPKTPQEALQSLRPAPGLGLDLVAHEPAVRQPLFVDFDHLGRMWVVHYVQYPDPAGLEVLTWDNHLRKVFDEIPPPPPYNLPEHQKFIGRDRISIHEDLDGDGFYETNKTFLEGLNMPTSFALDVTGIWILQPPYLLYYPDEDGDDRPDGPPEVHLSGFGLEDTHSIANSLKWGPDGWLYGATGSTVTARVKVEKAPEQDVIPFFGQTIWRYHPTNHRFELFAEGGWNNFGVDFDPVGRLYSGTNGNMQAVYFVQGGYYQKSFGKHGPHTNPHTYGHFYGLPVEGSSVRLVHQWILYQSGAIPALEGLLVGGNSLANSVHALKVTPRGSSFETHEVALPVETEDRWFRPVHATIGPDGAIYLADWYDARITHVDPRDNWDRERGRIYRLRDATQGPSKFQPMNPDQVDDLIERLGDENQWVRATARRLLGRDPTASTLIRLQQLILNAQPPQSLEALWTLARAEVLQESTLRAILVHPDAHMRRWAVRLMTDPASALESESFRGLLNLAKQEKNPEVLSQLASSSGRLPSDQGYPLTFALAERAEMFEDRYYPQQLWWALESHLTADPAGVLEWFQGDSSWQQVILREHLLERVARRLTASRDDQGLDVLSKLLVHAPDEGAASKLVSGMEKALEGTRSESIPSFLDQALLGLISRFPDHDQWVGFSMRVGSISALEQGRAWMRDPKLDDQRRIAMISLLAELKDPQSLNDLMELAVESPTNPALRVSALNALKRYDHPRIPKDLLRLWATLPDASKPAAANLLFSRASWTEMMLEAIENGLLPKEDVPYDLLVRLVDHGSSPLQAQVRAIWGRIRQPEATKIKRIREVEQILATFSGDPSVGEDLFLQTCSACHHFQGQGGRVGPELTGYDRRNLEFLLPAIIDPSLALREEYELATITMRPETIGGEGAVLSGFVTEILGDTLTLKDLAGQNIVIRLDDIASREHSATSIMPEGLLDGMSDQQVADLMAYLQAN